VTEVAVREGLAPDQADIDLLHEQRQDEPPGGQRAEGAGEFAGG
jgi:hypothetical protein